MVSYMLGFHFGPPSTPVSALVSVRRGEAASEGGWRVAGCARRPQFTVDLVQDALWRGIHCEPDKREVGGSSPPRPMRKRPFRRYVVAAVFLLRGGGSETWYL